MSLPICVGIYRSKFDVDEEIVYRTFFCYTAKHGGSQVIISEISNKKLSPDEAAWIQSLTQYKNGFIAAMNDDLNTADAIAAMFELVRAANTALSEASSKSAVTATVAAPPARV